MRAILSPKAWTIAGSAAAVGALLLSAYVFYAGTELSKRTMMANLALDAHEKVYEFLAQVNQKYAAAVANSAPERQIKGDPIHPDIRIAFVRAEGAIARASIIDNQDIRVCLTAMSQLMGGLIESSMATRQDFSVEDYVLEMDDFPDMIRRYIVGEAFASEQRRVTRDTAISECGPMPFRLPES